MYPPPAYLPYGLPPGSGRSAIPKVVGILAIIFSVLGIGGSLLWSLGPMSDIRSWGYADDLSQLVLWMYVWLAISFVLFGVHLVGGILALQYKAGGLQMLGIYASSAIVLVVVDIILEFALAPHLEGRHAGDMRFSVTVMRLVFDGLALPWPIIVLSLIKSRRAKQACGLVEPAA